MKIKNYSLIIITLLILSCRDNLTEKQKDSIGTLQKEHFIGFLKIFSKDYKNYNRIIVIPGSGCTGCINQAETFFSKNYQNNSNLYIFTVIGDVKIFKLKISKKLYLRSNVIVDFDNILLQKGFISVYPSNVFLEEKSKFVTLTNFTE